MNLARMAIAQQRARRPSVGLMKPDSRPAPTGGWVSAQNLAAMAPGTCLQLINARPTTTGIAIRGGNSLHATVSLDEPVESLFAYVGATVKQFFAGDDGGIFPVTTVVDPEVPPTPDVTGQTSNYYSSVNYPVSGGYYMYAVNGTDDAQLYDGAAWQAVNAASVPIAVTSAPTDEWSQVNVYRNRLYFVRKNSLIVDYLGVDSLGGAASQLSLSGIFREGGSVFFTATWSSESGSSAIADYLVVVSTEGEFAVFQGSFPGGTDWSLVGVYDLSPPLGINGWMKAGGDIVVATERGMIPISAARFKDPAALSMDAVSKNVHPDWVAAAQQRRGVPWEICKWDNIGFYYINVPVVSDTTPPITFLGNLQTGAMSKYTGWDNRCFVINAGQMYFGCNDGTIRLAEVTGYDLDMPYTYQVALAWDHLGPPAFLKTVTQAKAEFTTTRPFNILISASTDYTQQFPNPPNVLADPSVASLWDVGLWDQALWDSGDVLVRLTTRYQSVGRTGEVFSLEIQVPIGNPNTPNAELTVLHFLSQLGGMVV